MPAKKYRSKSKSSSRKKPTYSAAGLKSKKETARQNFASWHVFQKHMAGKGLSMKQMGEMYQQKRGSKSKKVSKPAKKYQYNNGKYSQKKVFQMVDYEDEMMSPVRNEYPKRQYGYRYEEMSPVRNEYPKRQYGYRFD